jgi:hypothetical protein
MPGSPSGVGPGGEVFRDAPHCSGAVGIVEDRGALADPSPPAPFACLG